MLDSATEHYRRQQRIGAAALLEARRARRRAPRDVARLVTLYQLAAARDAVESVPLMLDEQGLSAPAEGQVAITSLAGTASDGRPLETLFSQAEAAGAFDLMVVTQLQDVARTAAGISLASRPKVTGYVRMLNPPSCSRCAILAGKFFRWNSGFERHPRCDCRHIPSTEALSGDLTTNPHGYFDSLSAAEQDRLFTKSGAQAIRDGADMNQVVNARRGMSTAARGVSKRQMLTPEQVGGRDVLITREGTTRRGLATRARTGRNMSARLMPESIYEVASDREDAIRLLRLHGYIF